MNSSIQRIALSLVAGVGLIMTPASAPAQFIPFRTGNPFTSNSLYSRNVSLFYSTPYGGYSLSFRRNFTSNYSTPYPVIASPGLNYGGVGSVPLIYGSSMASGFPSWDQYSMNLQRAQRANRVDPNARQVAFDQWVDQKGAKAIPAEKIELLEPDVRVALAQPLNPDILSGKALNQAVKAILALEAKRASAKPPFFTPDTLNKIVFQGGPHADTLNLLQNGIVLPMGPMSPEIEQARAQVLKGTTALVESVRSGKRPEPEMFEKLAVDARKLHDLYTMARGSEDCIRFLNRMESALFAATDRANDNLIVPNWHTIGASASDLARHMGRYNLEFAPASPDDDGAYFALHRGLVTYLADLAQTR